MVTLFGTAGAALGTLTCGWMVQALQSIESWSTSSAYRVVFILYSILGVAKLFLVLALFPRGRDRRVRSGYQAKEFELEDEGLLSDASEDGERPVLQAMQPKPSILQKIRSLVPTSRRSLAPSSTDSSGSLPSSTPSRPGWHRRRGSRTSSRPCTRLPQGRLARSFSSRTCSRPSRTSSPFPLARRLGPLKTMVFTHLPSALFLAMVPLPPAGGAGTWIAMALVSLRACTQSMDQAPRQAFIAASVLPSERTAVLGVVNSG